MSDIPDNVDWGWVARHLVDLQGEVRALRDLPGRMTALEREMRTMRDEFGVMAAILRRVDNNQGAYRDDIHAVYAMHRDLRARIETLEDK